MKKSLFYSFICLFVSLFSFSCCDIDNNLIVYPQPFYGFYWQPYSMNGNGQYAIGGYVNGQQSREATRAAIDGGTYTDFALYAWTKDSVVMDGYHGVFNGNTWGYSENIKYFDNDVAEYNFIGVMPQDGVQAFANGEVTVEAESFFTDDAEAQIGAQNGNYAEDRELLYAATTVTNANYPIGANLAFRHANAKVYLKFTSDDANTEIVDFTPSTPGKPEVNDTTDTWINLKKSSNTIASATKLKAPGETTYTNAAALPSEIVAEIKSYYSIDDGTPGNYNLSLGNSVWPSGVIKQLRVVKEIPQDYKKTVELYDGTLMDFFDGFKYIQDNGYDIQPANSGGKPDVWTYILLDAFVNGSAYTIVGMNYGESNSVPQYTIETTPEVPAVEGIKDIIILPATSENGNGTDAVISSYPSKVTATVSLDGIEMTELENESTLTFTKPEGKIYTTRVASPTTWYTFPSSVNSNDNVGYTVKFSYTYKGVTKYDNRVFIPTTDVQWVEGKYYTYIINISGKGNGVVDPTDADENDPTVPVTNEITVTPTVNDYEEGEEHEYTIK